MTSEAFRAPAIDRRLDALGRSPSFPTNGRIGRATGSRRNPYAFLTIPR